MRIGGLHLRNWWLTTRNWESKHRGAFTAFYDANMLSSARLIDDIVAWAFLAWTAALDRYLL